MRLILCMTLWTRLKDNHNHKVVGYMNLDQWANTHVDIGQKARVVLDINHIKGSSILN